MQHYSQDTDIDGQDTEYFQHCRDPNYFPFIVTSVFPHPHLFFNPWQPVICLHFYNVHISRILYKWHYIVCSLWDWIFHSVEYYQRLSRLLYVLRISSFLLLNNSQWNGFTTVCLSTPSLKDAWFVFRSGLLQIKLLQTFLYRFSSENKCSFSGINVQGCSCWVLW